MPLSSDPQDKARSDLLVMFGSSGDLAKKKLFPAIYRLECRGRLGVPVIGVARNDWTDAWQTAGNPEPLGMPLQYMVSGMAVAATNKYPNETVDVAFNPVGQVVGQFTKVEKTAAVIERWVQEYLESSTRLNDLNEAAAAV